MATTGTWSSLASYRPLSRCTAPGPLRRHAHPELAGELRETHRFERRHLLVTGLDELGLVAGSLPRGQQPVDAVPGETEDLPDIPVPQPGQQNVGNGVRHYPSLLYDLREM